MYSVYAIYSTTSPSKSQVAKATGVSRASNVCSRSRRRLLRPREVPIVDPLAPIGIRPAIHLPVNREPAPQHARGDERPDVEPHAVAAIQLQGVSGALVRSANRWYCSITCS